jgi:hypothetical protein
MNLSYDPKIEHMLDRVETRFCDVVKLVGRKETLNTTIN